MLIVPLVFITIIINILKKPIYIQIIAVLSIYTMLFVSFLEVLTNGYLNQKQML